MTGDIVWVPRPDGVLAALAVADGRELWSTQLGAPIVSAPAPAGDYLVVATFDGTVRALVTAPEVVAGPVAECQARAIRGEVGGGCCEADRGPPSMLAVLLVIPLARRRRRPHPTDRPTYR